MAKTKLTPIDLVAAPPKGKRRKKAKSWKAVEKQAAQNKRERKAQAPKPLPKLSGTGRKKSAKQLQAEKQVKVSAAKARRLNPTSKSFSRQGKKPGDKAPSAAKENVLLPILQKVYEGGDQAVKGAKKFHKSSRLLKEAARATPLGVATFASDLARANSEGTKQAAKGAKKLEKPAKEVHKKLKKLDKQAEKIPIAGPAIKQAGIPIDKAAKPVGKAISTGAKAIWYSPEAIKAAAKGRNVGKALSGKEKTPGSMFISEKTKKKYPGAAILLGGAVDLAAEAPLAVASGGQAQAYKQAGRQYAKQVGRELTKEAIKEAGGKKAGVKTLGDLPKKKQAEIEAKVQAAADNAEAQAIAKYGRKREVRLGIDARVPFSRGRRIEKTVPVTRPVTVARQKVEKKLDAYEKGAKRRHAAVRKIRDKMNATNVAVNVNAKSRHMSEYTYVHSDRAGVTKRATDAAIERDANNLYVALTKDIEKGADPRPRMVEIEAEIEKLGPNSKTPAARHLHRAQELGYSELVKRGLADPWGGQKLVPWNYNKIAGRTKVKQAAAELNTKSKLASKDVKTAHKQAKLTVKDPKVGDKTVRTPRKTLAEKTEAHAVKYDHPEIGVEMMSVDDLLKFREHRWTRENSKGQRNYAELYDSIKKDGIREPLILEYGEQGRHAYLGEGNTRLAIAKELGIDEVPVKVIRTRDVRKRRGANPVRGKDPDKMGYLPSYMSPSDIGLRGRRPRRADAATPKRDLGANEAERIAGSRARKVKLYTATEKIQEGRVKDLGSEIDKIDTELKNYAERPNTPDNLAAIKALKEERAGLVQRRGKANESLKSARREKRKAERGAEAQRRNVAKGDVTKAQEAKKRAAQNVKAHAALIKELRAAPATKNLEETTEVLESFAKRFEAIGDAKTAKVLRDEIKSKAAEPPFWTPRKFYSPEKAIKEPPPTVRELRKTKSRQMRKQHVAEADAKEGGQAYDFSPEAIVRDVAQNRSKAAEADYWREVSKVVADEGGDYPWYAITPKGITKETTEARAKQQVGEHGGRAVRLSPPSRIALERKAQLHHADFTSNTVMAKGRRAVGGWKRAAVLTPTNYFRNLIGDTTRAVAIGQAGGLHFKDALKIVDAERKRQKVERSSRRFADDLAMDSNHRVSDGELAKIMDQKITIGAGVTKREVTVGELIDEMDEVGILEGGMIRSDVLTGSRNAGTVRKPGPLERADRVVSHREVFSRSHLYMNARSAGLTKQQAAEVVRKALIDYGDVSAMEEALRRAWVPFIVFKGRNIATWGGHLIRRPGKVQQYGTVFDTLAQLSGYKDFEAFEKDVGEIAEQVPIPVPEPIKKALGINIINPTLPVGDLYNTYRDLTQRGQPLTVLGEQVFAARLIANMIPRAVEGEPTDNASKPIPGPLAQALKVAGLGSAFRITKHPDINGKVRWHAHPALFDAIGMNPETGALQRTQTSDKWYLPLINFFSGSGATNVKPYTGELQRVRRRIKEIERVDVKTAASDKQRSKLYAELNALKDYRDSLYAKQGAKWAKKKSGGSGSGGGGLPASGLGSGGLPASGL